jgi:iron complex outermembrane receptor protein
MANVTRNARRLTGLCLALAAEPGFPAAPQVADLADLSLEQLANIEVTSVSRRAERLSDAPASIYVITGDDIRRAGVHSLPEALRLAPNLQVARTSASGYAISARGFNNAIGNKLLVLIDGRTVYTPLFSGVFWDANGVMLEDVERIEVISGPGATLWGANAVNGVINVITRPAQATQGALLNGGAGNARVGAVDKPSAHPLVQTEVATLVEEVQVLIRQQPHARSRRHTSSPSAWSGTPSWPLSGTAWKRRCCPGRRTMR